MTDETKETLSLLVDQMTKLSRAYETTNSLSAHVELTKAMNAINKAIKSILDGGEEETT